MIAMVSHNLAMKLPEVYLHSTEFSPRFTWIAWYRFFATVSFSLARSMCICMSFSLREKSVYSMTEWYKSVASWYVFGAALRAVGWEQITFGDDFPCFFLCPEEKIKRSHQDSCQRPKYTCLIYLEAKMSIWYCYRYKPTSKIWLKCDQMHFQHKHKKHTHTHTARTQPPAKH